MASFKDTQIVYEIIQWHTYTPSSYITEIVGYLSGSESWSWPATIVSTPHILILAERRLTIYIDLAAMLQAKL